MARKKLPIGLQTLSELVTSNYIYVDKTEYCHRMIVGGKYYFLSRPRRFGKSLLISTLEEIFQGNRDLFKGMWIEDKIDWEPRPVIKLDFSAIVSSETPFAVTLDMEMDRIANLHGLGSLIGDYRHKFQTIIRELGASRPVAILVDEYDKPIVNYIDDMDRALENRDIMKNFYSVIKANDQSIAFFMLTGVSKFSRVSIFSDLNNLSDITLSPDFASIVGYTQDELNTYFADEIEELRSREGVSDVELMAKIKRWYNGYSWDGRNLVYNPFSILCLLQNRQFQNFWFETGTPTFLTKLIREQNYSALELDNVEVSAWAFNTFDIPNFEIKSLLFQTGYLTIKHIDRENDTVTLGFPNMEVERSFSYSLLAALTEKGYEGTDSLVLKLNQALRTANVSAFMGAMHAILADIAYPLHPEAEGGLEETERYYHSLFFLVLKILGYRVQVEVLTNQGRIDCVISTADHVFVIEFKLGDAASAMAQIKSKGYHQKYLASGKKIVLLGIGFDVAKRNVGDYLVEEVVA